MRSRLLAIVYIVFSVSSSVAQSCLSHEYRTEALKNPIIARQVLAAENFSVNNINTEFPGGAGGTGHGSALPVIRIPVVVHVLYKEADQNISDEQVLSQIEVLNKAFRHIHRDTGFVPGAFKALAADCAIEFVMAKVTPAGYATNGIVRKRTNAYSFGADDRIKFSASGGDDAWDADRYLNIWVGNMMTGIVGYSSLLGCAKNIDGIVMRYNAFGNIGKLQMPYVEGRVTVHEVGHWLGLRHIWGDQVCGNDGIDDTPPQKIATRNCPSGNIASCDNAPSGIMYNNYMDLTNDACMNMFTIGQRDRMRSVFAPGGFRNSLLSSNAATATPLPGPPPSEEEIISKVRMFPNPASGQVTIDVSAHQALIGKTIGLYNQVGQQVMTIRITRATTTIHLRSLNDGVYFLQMGSGVKPFKLVKTSAPFNNP